MEAFGMTSICAHWSSSRHCWGMAIARKIPWPMLNTWKAASDCVAQVQRGNVGTVRTPDGRGGVIFSVFIGPRWWRFWAPGLCVCHQPCQWRGRFCRLILQRGGSFCPCSGKVWARTLALGVCSWKVLVGGDAGVRQQEELLRSLVYDEAPRHNDRSWRRFVSCHLPRWQRRQMHHIQHWSVVVYWVRKSAKHPSL